MIFAPVLQDLARRLTPNAPAVTEQPSRWAYAMREAIDATRPQWIVTHHDPRLEIDAVAAQLGAGADGMDLDLTQTPAVGAMLDYVGTLAELYPQEVVAASLTGPGRLVAALPSDDGLDVDDLLVDCADAIARLAAEYVERGARRILVWEPDHPGNLVPSAVAAAHEPLLRRVRLLDVDAVLCGERIDGEGYAAVAGAHGGRGAALLDPSAFRPGGDAGGAWPAAVRRAGRNGIVLTDGALAADSDLARLRTFRNSTPAG